MNILRWLSSDSALSLIFHGMKSLIAFYVNWLVLSEFASEDYLTWCVASSILMVATASDLGIGQFTVTQLIHSSAKFRADIIKTSLVVIFPLAFFSFVFVYFLLNGDDWRYRALMAAFLGLRILSIPYAALLNAFNLLKLRKVIEFFSYSFTLLAVHLVIFYKFDVKLALLAMNFSFLLGAAVTTFIAIGRIQGEGAWSLASAGNVYKNCFPFLVNNLSGLATYAGFIWLSSYLLGPNELAILAVLHSFVLMNFYQIYEVFLKARHADLTQIAKAEQVIRLNWIVMFFLPIIFFAAGPEILSLMAKKIEFNRLDLVLFALFMGFELGFLMLQSVAQVQLDLSVHLTKYSVGRVVLFLFAIITFSLCVDVKSLQLYLSLLTLASIFAFAFVKRDIYKVWRKCKVAR